MADAWGGAWGDAWGSSWGTTAAVVDRGDIVVREGYNKRKREMYRALQAELDRQLAIQQQPERRRKKNKRRPVADDLPEIVGRPQRVEPPSIQIAALPETMQEAGRAIANLAATIKHDRDRRAALQKLQQMAEELMMRDDEEATVMLLLN